MQRLDVTAELRFLAFLESIEIEASCEVCGGASLEMRKRNANRRLYFAT